MGLDMYLHASKYIGGWYHSPNEEKTLYATILHAVDFPAKNTTEQAPSLTVNVNVAYWRKANAIHAWFVQYCGDGIDDCRRMYVNREKLAGLKQTCTELLESRDTIDATEKLPPQGGFFFGGTEVDEYYWAALESTVEQINKALTLSEDWDFYYEASW